MSNYTITKFADVENSFAKRGWPGEMKFLKKPLETEQVALSYRKMPPQSGGKGGKGHKHKTQEEVFVVLSGTLQFKLDDEVVDVTAPAAVRIAPPVVRSVWNDSDRDAEVLIVSTWIENLGNEIEMVDGFWPTD